MKNALWRGLRSSVLFGLVCVFLLLLAALYSMHKTYGRAWAGTASTPYTKYSSDFLLVAKGMIDPREARLSHARLSALRARDRGDLPSGMFRWHATQLGLLAYIALFVSDDLLYEKLFSFSYFGGVASDGGPAMGAQDAARSLYRNSLSDITAAQAVTMLAFYRAGLSRNGSSFSRIRELVLSRLEEKGIFSAEEARRIRSDLVGP